MGSNVIEVDVERWPELVAQIEQRHLRRLRRAARARANTWHPSEDQLQLADLGLRSGREPVELAEQLRFPSAAVMVDTVCAFRRENQ